MVLGLDKRKELENSSLKDAGDMAKTPVPTIIYEKQRLQKFPMDWVDGVNFINISMKSKSELGRRLHSGYNHAFALFGGLGACSSVRTFIGFITHEEFPEYLLTKKRWEPEDSAKVSKEKVFPKNYLALLAFAICSRIRNDAAVIKMLKENTLPFTAFKEMEEESLLEGKDDMGAKFRDLTYGMAAYIAIIRNIEELIKADKFDNANMKKLINDCKAYPDEDIFAGLPSRVLKLIQNRKSALKEEEQPTQDAEAKKASKKSE